MTDEGPTFSSWIPAPGQFPLGDGQKFYPAEQVDQAVAHLKALLRSLEAERDHYLDHVCVRCQHYSCCHDRLMRCFSSVEPNSIVQCPCPKFLARAAAKEKGR